MKMQSIIPVLLAIVIGVAMIPTVMQSVEDADLRTNTENFTAVEDDTVEEVLTVEETIENLSYVTVEGETLSEDEYDFTGTDVTVDASSSNVDDDIVVSYQYEGDLGLATQSLIDLLPILFVVILVAGTVSYVRFK